MSPTASDGNLQTVVLSGTVRDDHGAPVPGAFLRLVGPPDTAGSSPQAASTNRLAVSWTRSITGFSGHRWNCWTKFVAGEVAGISWPEFKQTVVLYNPSLARTGYVFRADRTYLLPVNEHVSARIVWDRPLTGFSGNRWDCWKQFVQNRVVGLTWSQFAADALAHNPGLAADGYVFKRDKTYWLPRNEGQTEYALTTFADVNGRYQFTGVPTGDYRLEISADGYLPFSNPVHLAQSMTLDPTLTPLVAAPPTPGPDFVRASGNRFYVGSQWLRFIGVNVRGLVHYGAGQPLPYSTRDQRREQLSAVRAMGARVVRVFLANKYASPEQIKNRLADLLGLMKDQFPDLYLIPALTNYYSDVGFSVQGDDAFYDAYLKREFFATGYKVNYLPFVETIVKAFRDEPRVFAWEIGNELKVNPFDPNRPDDPGDPYRRIFVNFMRNVADAIRGWDPNHLITTGLISTRAAWLFDDRWKRELYGSPNLDFVTVHAYNYQGQLKEDDRPIAVELKKPFIIEEAGFSSSQYPDRVPLVRDEMQRAFGLGASGYMPWGFLAVNADNGDGDRDIGMDRLFHTDWDGLFDAYRQQAQAL